MVAAHKFFGLSSDELGPEAEETFFTSIMAKNGTYKTTFHSRFSRVNEELLRLLSSNIISAHAILDVGISSGISTLELYEYLSLHGYDTRIVGTDLLIDAYLVAVLPGGYALVDKSGFPLRLDVLGYGMKPWVTRRDYSNGFFLVRKGFNVLFRKLAKRKLLCLHPSDVRRVELVTPRLLKETKITALEDDIVTYNPDFEGKFDFVRAANVLNRGYFSDEKLQAIVANLKRYMAPSNSSLLVMRTHEDKSNHGTLFGLQRERRFIPLERFGEGSEIESLVLEA